MRKYFFYLYTAFLTSCGASGYYCTTVPYEGDCHNGYQQVKLESGGRCIISQCGDSYANYGRWIETDEGIVISNVEGDFSRYDGTYEWREHNNARGVGKSGKVLKLIESGEIGIQLFPL